MACGQQDGPGSDGEGGRTGDVAGELAGELIGMAGVRDAWVGEEKIEQDTFANGAVVDLDADADPDEVAAVLQALARADLRTAEVHLGSGTTERLDGPDGAEADGIWGVPPGGAEDAASRWAEVLVAGAAAVDGAAVGVGGGQDGTGGDPRLEVAVEQVDPASVGAALEAVASDPVLATLDEVVVRASDGGLLPAEDGGPGSLSVTVGDGVDDTVVGAWGSLAAALDRWPREGTVLPAALALVRDAGALEVRLDLELSSPPARRRLTPATWGDRVWPLVRPVLDAVRDLPRGTRVLVTDGRGDELVSVAVGRGTPGPDRLGRTWSAEAAAYLAG